MEAFYDVTKRALEEAKNERLSVKTDLKLARLWLARKEWTRLGKVSWQSGTESHPRCMTDHLKHP